MKRSKDAAVQNFLDGIMLSDAEKYNSLSRMREIVFEMYPQVSEKMMYGGILFATNSEDFCGLFVRQNHISFEFSKGYLMDDPNSLLEGKGQFRRHLKIRSKEDILHKLVSSFVKQAG